MPQKFNPIQLLLTCGSWQEAQKIADALLQKRLVACVEMMEITSKYRWQGALEEAKEIKLIMETIADHVETIEQEVAKLHSYETFVLQAVSVTHMSKRAAAWLEAETKK